VRLPTLIASGGLASGKKICRKHSHPFSRLTACQLSHPRVWNKEKKKLNKMYSGDNVLAGPRGGLQCASIRPEETIWSRAACRQHGYVCERAAKHWTLPGLRYSYERPTALFFPYIMPPILTSSGCYVEG